MLEAHAKEIEIPQGVEVETSGRGITARLAGKELSRHFPIHGITIEKSGGRVIVGSGGSGKRAKKFVNTVSAHIRNIFDGLTKGYRYRLRLVYSHFPMSVSVKGEFVEVTNILGAKSPKKARIMAGAGVEVKDKDIIVTGTDKEVVGQTAANIERITRSTKRDTRRFQDGIYLVEKGAAKAEGGGGE